MAKKKKERRYASPERRQKEHKAGYASTVFRLPDGVEQLKVNREGMIKLDFVPAIVGPHNPYADEGELYWELTYYIHRGIGSDDNSYVCPAKTFGRKCPICEYHRKLSKMANQDPDFVKSFAPKERQLFYVLDAARPEQGVKLLDMSHHLFGKILDLELRADEQDDGDHQNFWHFEGGSTVRCGIKEESMGGNSRTFFSVGSVAFKHRSVDLDSEVGETLPPLDSLLVEHSYDQLKGFLFDSEQPSTSSKASKPADEDEEEDEEEDTPPPKKKSKSPKTAKPPVDEDEWDDELDEEEDEDNDNDEEDAPPPRKKGKPAPAKQGKSTPTKKGKPAVEDDEWDDEDEEDEEDDHDEDDDVDTSPPPKKRKAPPAKKGKPAPAKGKPSKGKPVDEDEEEDEDEDEEDWSFDD